MDDEGGVVGQRRGGSVKRLTLLYRSEGAERTGYMYVASMGTSTIRSRRSQERRLCRPPGVRRR